MNNLKPWLLLSLLTLVACQNQTRPDQAPTVLPMSVAEQQQLEDNEGYSGQTHLLLSRGRVNLLFNHVMSFEKYLNQIHQIELELNPFKHQFVDLDLPASSQHNRVLSSLVSHQGEEWLYYSTGDSLKDDASFYRIKKHQQGWGNQQAVSLPKKLKLIHWAGFYSTSHERFVMVFRDGQGMFFSTSDDGLHFTSATRVDERGAMPHFSEDSQQRYYFAYQQGQAHKGLMTAKVSVSEDQGQSWNTPLVITQNSDNVHDAFLMKRKDGQMDVYYIYPPGDWRGFALFRRCIRMDLSLGPEEPVMVKETGHVAKPSVHRLDDDQLLLTYINQNQGFNLFSRVFRGDADCG